MNLTLISNERLTRPVFWTTVSDPLFENLERNYAAGIVRPPPLRSGTIGDWCNVARSIRRAETLFWMQPSSRPPLPLHIASFAKLRVTRSAFVIDPWSSVLGKIGLAAVIQKLDPCFVPFRESQRELQRLYPTGRFEWLPFGIDTKIFKAPADAERPVFAFWMGRRYEPLHRALLDYCQARGLRYEYRRDGTILSTQALGALAGQSKYFVVTPPDLDNPARTGGVSPLVMRYMEGLSAGARLLGVLPKSGEYETLLPLDAICRVSADGHDLAGVLDADLASPDGWAALAPARERVRSRHSWARRAQQIHARLVGGVPIDLEAP